MLGNFNKNEVAGINAGKSSTGTAALAEVKEGAERLARELNEYLTKSSSNKRNLFGKGGPSSTSGEAVADLQLATARKLREVCPKHTIGPFCYLSVPSGVLNCAFFLLRFFALFLGIVTFHQSSSVIYSTRAKLDSSSIELAEFT